MSDGKVEMIDDGMQNFYMESTDLKKVSNQNLKYPVLFKNKVMQSSK
jgi:hypothetical protein